jgi:mannosyltransferase OCH1-like enzyme
VKEFYHYELRGAAMKLVHQKRIFILVCIARVIIISSASGVQAGAETRKWHVDFDVSMEKGSKAYEKKYKKSHNREKLAYVKALYEKNNLARVKYNKKIKIPRIIHQIWVGEKPLPQTYTILKESWIKHHPGWSYKLWTNKEVSKLRLYNQDFYNAATDPVEKANILRYELLDKFGGVYVDIDFQCLRSLEPLHHCYDFYTGIEPNDSAHLLNNALIACSAGHSLMRYCIETIKNDMHLESRYHRTGVGHFSRSFMAMAHKVSGVTIAFPASYFYPLHIHYSSHAKVIRCLKPESFAVHYWANEYGDSMPQLAYAKKKIEAR